MGIFSICGKIKSNYGNIFHLWQNKIQLLKYFLFMAKNPFMGIFAFCGKIKSIYGKKIHSWEYFPFMAKKSIYGNIFHLWQKEYVYGRLENLLFGLTEISASRCKGEVNWGPPRTPQFTTVLWGSRGFKGAVNLAPMMPRDASLLDAVVWSLQIYL